MAKPRGIKIPIGATDDTAKAFGSVDRRMKDLERKSFDVTKAMGKAFGNVATGIATMGAAAGAAAVGGLLILTQQAIELAESLDKMAQATGITVEDLSTLKFASEQAGGGIEVVEKGATRLARNMREANTGNKAAIEAFRDMGVEFKNADGSLRRVIDVFYDTADAFAVMEDGANKTSLAQDAYGKGAAKLIPLLNSGADGMKRLQQEARDLGVEISTAASVQAADFLDQLNKLKTAAMGMGIALSKDVLPSLLKITTGMANAAKEGGLLKATMVGIAEAVVQMGQASGLFAASGVDRIQQEIVQLEKSVPMLRFQLGKLKAAFVELDNRPELKTLPSGELASGPADMLRKIQRTMSDLGEQETRLGILRERFDSLILPDETNLAQKKPDPTGIDTGPSADQAATEEEDRRARVEENAFWDIEMADAKATRLAEEAEARIALDQSVSQALMDEETKRSNTSMKQAKARQKAQISMDRAMARQKVGLLGALAGAVEAFGGKSFYLQKAAALAQVLMDTRVGVMKALALDPIRGPALAGWIKATGAINAAGIIGQTLSGSGGSGGGGVGSPPLGGGAAAFPEPVAVSPVDAVTGAATPMGASVNVELIIQGDFVGSDEKMQEIMEFIETASGDNRTALVTSA